MQLEDDYPGIVRELCRVIREDRPLAKARYYMNSDGLAEALRYPSQHNQMVYDLLASLDGTYLGVTAPQLVAAQKGLAKRRKAETASANREAAHAAREAAKEQARLDKEEAKKKRAEQRQMDFTAQLQDQLGGVPTTEREFIALKTNRDGLSMSFDRQFQNNAGDRLTAEQVILDLHLCAADLALVKPRGDLLGATNIDRAFEEWAIGQRTQCIETVIERIIAPPRGVDPDKVLASFEQVCGYYFREPAFASKVLQKMVWQVKRMLIDLPYLPVEHRHMVVFVGEQGSGKTFVERRITDPIRELVAEASMKDVLDERQMELPTFGVILLDELVGGDRADLAALKNFITGSDWARRPMRTNSIQKVKVRATLFGTSNISLGSIIYDSTGARRFIELDVRPRAEVEPNWRQIMDFNWLELWQAVDVEAADPLMSSEYADLLLRKQEELRNALNAELWLRQYEPSRDYCKHVTAEYMEFYAADLYEQFMVWEREYDRGWKGTSLTRWGRDMKSLLDSGSVAGWSYHMSGPKKIYRCAITKQEEAPVSTGSSIVPWRRNAKEML